MPELPQNTSNNITQPNQINAAASKKWQGLDVMNNGCLLGDRAGVSAMVKEGAQLQSEM